MTRIFSSSKNPLFNLHGSRPSSSLQTFLRLLISSREKNRPQPNLIFLNKFSGINIPVLQAGIKSNNLSYFGPSSSILSSVFSSLCFLHIFTALLSLCFQHHRTLLPSFSLTKILKKKHRFDSLNLLKKLSPELHLSTQSVSIHIDKSKYNIKRLQKHIKFT